MNRMKKGFLAILLCTVCTGCRDYFDEDPDDLIGTDWRTTGVARDGGTVIADGEETYVHMCVHSGDAVLYYDSEDQIEYAWLDYPAKIEGDPWEAFKGADFEDCNGDGDTDVTMHFIDGEHDMTMVWYWDSECLQFLYQPEASEIE